MATLEHELTRGGQARPREHHVFVSAGGRRRRALRAAGVVAGALALVWLVALGLALAGSARLPGLPAPDAKPLAARDATAASTATAAPARPHAGAHLGSARPGTPRRLEQRRAAPFLSPARPVRSIPPVRRATPVSPATSTTTQAPAAATQTQGWSQRGWTNPPGQTKRSEPKPRGSGPSTDLATPGATRGNGHGKG
jgi:hypothetical protein